MEKAAAPFRSVLNPKPPIIVSCRGKDGKDNALVVVYACNCSFDPPMVRVGVTPERHSHRLIKESGCFVVNLVPESMKAVFDYVGSHSGRDGDKLAACGAKVADGAVVAAPILVDCPVNIECKVVDSIRTGSHEMFVGKIEYVHADKNLMNADGKIDFSGIDFLKL